VRRFRVFAAVSAALIMLTSMAVSLRAPAASAETVREAIVRIANAEVGSATSPAGTDCNKYSAYWGSGSETCGNTGNRSIAWCADFASWVWRMAGGQFTRGTNDINATARSFYSWGVAHGTWHPVRSGYTPQPGDVAYYAGPSRADDHVGVVISMGSSGPNVVNGNWAHGVGYKANETSNGDNAYLAGYTSPDESSGFSEGGYVRNDAGAVFRVVGGKLFGLTGPECASLPCTNVVQHTDAEVSAYDAAYPVIRNGTDVRRDDGLIARAVGGVLFGLKGDECAELACSVDAITIPARPFNEYANSHTIIGNGTTIASRSSNSRWVVDNGCRLGTSELKIDAALSDRAVATITLCSPRLAVNAGNARTSHGSVQMAWAGPGAGRYVTAYAIRYRWTRPGHKPTIWQTPSGWARLSKHSVSLPTQRRGRYCAEVRAFDATGGQSKWTPPQCVSRIG
jgi:hypothetical protein